MNERDWIPAHRRLFKGAKKGWPRAVRFILLELCHEARPTGGALDFPVEWDTLSALHDRLGGDRRELRKALALFQIRDDSGQPVIEVERDLLRHRLKIVKWETWCGPRSGAERAETHKKRVLEKSNALLVNSRVTPTGEDSTEQERRGSDAHAREGGDRSPERRLKTVPPPPPKPDPEPPESIEPEEPVPRERFVEMVHRVWLEMWQAKYHRPYESSGGRLQGERSEDQVEIRIAELASIRSGREEAYVRHKFAAYFRDKGRNGWLDEKCHPLRCIEHDWAAYGEPKEPKRMVPWRDEPEVELLTPEQMATRAFAAMNLKVGNGGT